MSGTTSPSPLPPGAGAPSTEALIVAHGQPSEPEPPEADIAALAGRVAALLPGFRVRGATLAMPGALDAALAEAAAPPLVYPLFMSDGWFTKTELPRRLAGRAGRHLSPLGLDPALPEMAADGLAACAEARGWRLAEVTLLIAAHGSGRSQNAARATRDFGARLGQRAALAQIRYGFVEEAPSVAEAAAGLGPRAICLPFFAARGEHMIEDVPQALDRAGFLGARLDPIGTDPRVPELIAQSLRTAARPTRQAGA